MKLCVVLIIFYLIVYVSICTYNLSGLFSDENDNSKQSSANVLVSSLDEVRDRNVLYANIFSDEATSSLRTRLSDEVVVGDAANVQFFGLFADPMMTVYLNIRKNNFGRDIMLETTEQGEYQCKSWSFPSYITESGYYRCDNSGGACFAGR